MQLRTQVYPGTNEGPFGPSCERTTGFEPATPTLARGYGTSCSIPVGPVLSFRAGQQLATGEVGTSQDRIGRPDCDPKRDPPPWGYTAIGNGISLRPVRPEELERRLQERLDALGPAPRAELLHVLMLPDFERADRIGEFWGYPESRAFAELLIDCEEDRTLWRRWSVAAGRQRRPERVQ